MKNGLASATSTDSIPQAIEIRITETVIAAMNALMLIAIS
jgi:hypothetical protein